MHVVCVQELGHYFSGSFMKQPVLATKYYTDTKARKSRKLGQLIQNLFAHSGVVLSKDRALVCERESQESVVHPWCEFTAVCHRTYFLPEAREHISVWNV